jgi:hypothetical protein
LNIASNNALTSLDLSALTTAGNSFYTVGNTALTSLNLSALTTAGDGLNIASNNALTSLNLSALVPASGHNDYFSGNALSAATVNGLLARYIANSSYIAGSIDLSGGTNATPTGQGIIDAQTLCGRGVTVNLGDGAGGSLGCNVITWNSQPSGMTVGDSDQALTQATANSGLTVTYSTSTTDYCTISGDVGSQLLHAVAAGTCVVHADQAGDSTHMAALRVDSGSITIRRLD